MGFSRQSYSGLVFEPFHDVHAFGELHPLSGATGVHRKQRAMHYATHELHASGFWVVVVFDFLLTGTTRGLSTTAQGARIMFHLCAQNFAKIVDDIRQQT